MAQSDDGNDYYYSAIFITNLAAGIYFARVEGKSGSVDPDYYFSLDLYNRDAELTSIQSATNGIGITWDGDASFNYRVEEVDQFSQSVVTNLPWAAVTNLEGRVGENQWTEPGSTSAKWYRVVTP